MKNENPVIESLPAELDNAGVIFSYGSLLEPQKLRDLLTDRRQFKIFETDNAKYAAKLVNLYSSDIVILKDVRIVNVRVSIFTETILRRWYENRGKKVQELITAGIAEAEIPKALFLFARPAELHEKGKILNGGLICNLTRDELLKLDKYEWNPVMKRTRVNQITIEDRCFSPNYITFYAGTESAENITAEEKAERGEMMNFNRIRGCLSPQAKWRRNVRQR